MKRFRLLPILFVLAGILLLFVLSFRGAPTFAQPNAQATATPAATPAANPQDQIYVTLLPSASGPVKLVVLRLKTDGQAELVTDPLGDAPAVTQVGTFNASGDTVTVTWSDASAKPITFKQDSEKLVATEYDKTLYGERGLTLYLRDAVEAALTDMKRAYVTVDLAAGFPLDPFLVSVNGGGELDASVLSDQCHGYINDSPTVTVHWSGQADLVRAFTYSDADPALVIQTPEGKFLCGDDASTLMLDSQIEIANPPAGTYNIWVASAKPKQLLPTILVLTAHSDVTLANFQLGNLVKRPPLPASGSTLPKEYQAKIITEAIARYKGAIGGPLAATALTQQTTSAGSIAAFEIDLGSVNCNGFIADTPDYVFDVTTAPDQFTVLFEGKQDATLMVVGPDGKVQCNDDSVEGVNTNPAIMFSKPQTGRYAVFVGRLNQDAPVEGTITVTTDPSAAPGVVSPE